MKDKEDDALMEIKDFFYNTYAIELERTEDEYDLIDFTSDKFFLEIKDRDPQYETKDTFLIDLKKYQRLKNTPKPSLLLIRFSDEVNFLIYYVLDISKHTDPENIYTSHIRINEQEKTKSKTIIHLRKELFAKAVIYDKR